jgi:hypothetical protein
MEAAALHELTSSWYVSDLSRPHARRFILRFIPPAARHLHFALVESHGWIVAKGPLVSISASDEFAAIPTWNRASLHWVNAQRRMCVMISKYVACPLCDDTVWVCEDHGNRPLKVDSQRAMLAHSARACRALAATLIAGTSTRCRDCRRSCG